LTADTAPPELAQDEELGHLVRRTTPDHRHAGNGVVAPEEKRLPVFGLRPVAVQVEVAELAVLAYVPSVDLGEVMGVELQQAREQRSC